MWILISNRDLDRFVWEQDDEVHSMKAKQPEELEQYLNGKKIKYDLLSKSGGHVSTDTRKQAQFAAVKRGFHHDWMKIEPKLRTSIVEGISVYLSLFDDNPSVKYTFANGDLRRRRGEPGRQVW